MCGIAGFIGEGKLSHQDRAAVLDRMCRVIEHRGPDDQGTFIKGEAALGMRRLSIIDLAGGHQPISNEDGTVTVVFNGEIYNYRELQGELEAHGHLFKTNSDTEAIVHAYEEYGEQCVNRLRGMFAFAVWDERKKKLFLARDRVGKKPLYYSDTRGGSFIFGSELKALLEHPEATRDVNLEAVDEYLSFGYVPDPLCIFRDVKKLPPGHYLTLVNGNISVKKYWDFNYEPVEFSDEEEILDRLRVLLDEAVRMRLVSDVPLGAFLSGGIDSTAVVGLMARNLDRPVKTFSIGFNEDSFNELKYARIAARRFGTDHHEFIVTPEICQIVDELVWHFDEPFADSSAIPTYMVSKLAREHVTVVLSGDGGDELFAGYDRYITDRKRSGFARIPRSLRHGMMQPLSRRLPHGAWGRNFIHNIALDPLDRYIDSVSVFTSLNKTSLCTDSFRAQLHDQSQVAECLRDCAVQAKTGERLDQILYIDSKMYLPGDILTKVDRMSMAVSLEVRSPLLDHKLIEFVTRIPASMKLRGLQSKHILKRAVQDIVPAEILNRSKQGFGLPIGMWINQQLRERMRDTLMDLRARQRGYLKQEYVTKLLDEHERGRRDHSTALWALLMLELWHRSFVDGDVGSEGFTKQLCA
jgi:asparagine synthase (glutamine-hydrolysing)